MIYFFRVKKLAGVRIYIKKKSLYIAYFELFSTQTIKKNCCNNLLVMYFTEVFLFIRVLNWLKMFSPV